MIFFKLFLFFLRNKVLKMKLIKRLGSLYLIALLSFPLNAQELNFKITVVPPSSRQGQRLVDAKIYKSLEAAMQELFNNTKWTDDIFEQNERITGSIQVNIKSEVSTTRFTAELAIQATRPIFGTEQTTPLFVHLDREVTFNYEQYQPLQYTKNNFTDNLTATLAYYAYIILAMDYDSFSPQGGEQYWQLSQDIFNTVTQDNKKEWQGADLGNRNRYWFIENYLSPRLKGVRQAIYQYHRQGLDVAHLDVNRCKSSIIQALEKYEEAQQTYPNTLAVRSFAATKTEEMIDIFKNGTPEQKSKFIQIMQKLDPANSSKYNQVGF
jgi:hypothetical protein